MNTADLDILEMYFRDGMKEAEIAESMGLSLLTVQEVLAAFENGETDIDDNLLSEEV